MCLESHRSDPGSASAAGAASQKGLLSRQHGVGLPFALFIILILSIVGLAVNRLSESSSQSYAANIAGQRAYLMSYSALQQQLIGTLASSSCQCTAASTSVSFSLAGLSDCSATVSCSSFVAEGQSYCDLVSVASCDNGNASRTLEVRVK